MLGQLAHARQQPVAEHRRHRQRDDEAGEDRDDECDAERREQPPLDARQREHRQEHEHDDDRRVDDAGAHLCGGSRNDLDHAAPVAALGRPVQAEATIDILHVDHSVVDQRADGDGKPAERHGVDRQPHQLEHHQRAQHRQRDGDQRDERRLPVEQEHEQHDGDADQRFDQHAQQVGDGGLDEARLAELDIGGAHALRHHLLQLGQHRLDPARNADGVGLRLLLHSQDDTRLAVEAGIAPLGAGARNRRPQPDPSETTWPSR